MNHPEYPRFWAALAAAFLVGAPLSAAPVPQEDLEVDAISGADEASSEESDPKETDSNVYPDGFMGPLPPGACYASQCSSQGIDPLSGQTSGSTLNASSDACTPWRIPCAWPPPEGLDPKDGLTQPPPGKYIQKSPGGDFICDSSVCTNCEYSEECKQMKASEKSAQDKLKAEEEQKKKDEKAKAEADRLAKESKAEDERKGQCLNCRTDGPSLTASNSPETSNPGRTGSDSPGTNTPPAPDPGADGDLPDDSFDPDTYNDQVDSYANGPALGFELAGIGGAAGSKTGGGAPGDPFGSDEPAGGGTFQQIIDTSRNLRGSGDGSTAAGQLSGMNAAGRVSEGEADAGLDSLWGKFRKLWNEEAPAPAPSTPDNIKPVPFQGVKNDPS